MKPLNEWSFSKFRSLIMSASKNPYDEWFFSQSRNCWYADYRPKYPEKTAADFTIVVDHSTPNPRMTIYQDTATLPTIKQYSNVHELTADLRNME